MSRHLQKKTSVALVQISYEIGGSQVRYSNIASFFSHPDIEFTFLINRWLFEKLKDRCDLEKPHVKVLEDPWQKRLFQIASWANYIPGTFFGKVARHLLYPLIERAWSYLDLSAYDKVHLTSAPMLNLVKGRESSAFLAVASNFTHTNRGGSNTPLFQKFVKAGGNLEVLSPRCFEEVERSMGKETLRPLVGKSIRVAANTMVRDPGIDNEVVRDERRILFVHRMEWMKRPHMLIDLIADANLVDEGFSTAMRGKGSLLPEIESLIRAKDLSDSVEIGFSVDLAVDYQRSGFFLALSEGTNNPSQSVIEATMAGCIPVLSDDGDSHLLLPERYHSLLLVKADVPAISARLKTILEMSPEERQVLRDDLRSWALEMFHPDKYVNWLADFYLTPTRDSQ